MPAWRYVVLASLAALPACGVFKSDLDKCHEMREYQQAKPGPRVRVPDDLQPLNAEARLEVPYGETNLEATPKDRPCLIEPPSYTERDGN